ncbi:MAG: hypothetical protein GY758_01485 [Fuerstiella sp.]|nr:hypothetical protein [Fuerstiella sp.]MCP4512928.1 hypothetical protein [Fuerstiella sp.]
MQALRQLVAEFVNLFLSKIVEYAPVDDDWGLIRYPNFVRVGYSVSLVPLSVVRIMLLKMSRVWFVG